jgi:hypothetical protein
MMFNVQPYYTATSISTSASPEKRSSLPIPTVYEQLPAKMQRWEYHVLTVETSEASLPTAERLNALGKEGWILVGLLDERATGKGMNVHYYFARLQEDV